MGPSPLRRREAIALLAAIAVAWGTSWPVIKAILQDLSPMGPRVLINGIWYAVLFAISAFRRSLVLPQRGDIPVVLNIGLLHMVAFTGLVTIGLQFVPAGRSVVLGYTTPLWVTIGARLFLGETLALSRVIGLIVGLSGLLLLFDPSTFNWSNHDSVIGNALVLVVLGRKHFACARPQVGLHALRAGSLAGIARNMCFRPLGTYIRRHASDRMECSVGRVAALRGDRRDSAALLGHADRQP